MKKFLLLLAFFPSVLFAQDKIHTIQGKTLEVKIVEIGEDVVYKDFNNQDGPNYRIPSNEIASIVLQDGKVIEMISIPDGFERPTELVVKGRAIYGDGVKIPKDSYIYLFGKDGTDSINSGLKLKGIGNILTIVGCFGLAFGSYMAAAHFSMLNNGEIDGSDKSLITVASGTIGAGISCLVASIPLKSVAKHKINDVVENYNNPNQHATLSIGATNYGFGLALVF